MWPERLPGSSGPESSLVTHCDGDLPSQWSLFPCGKVRWACSLSWRWGKQWEGVASEGGQPLPEVPQCPRLPSCVCTVGPGPRPSSLRTKKQEPWLGSSLPAQAFSFFPPPWCPIAHPSSPIFISSSHQCGRVCREMDGPRQHSGRDDSLCLSVSRAGGAETGPCHLSVCLVRRGVPGQ